MSLAEPSPAEDRGWFQKITLKIKIEKGLQGTGCEAQGAGVRRCGEICR